MAYVNSILLGKSNDGKLYQAEGYQHIFLLAPHGSGKGVTFVLPTLLTLEESCIVHDIKLENYELTSGYRASIGHKIFVFNPLSLESKTHRYNPLDFISTDTKQKVNDIQKIADLLISHKEAASKMLFVGIVLYLSAINGKKTLGEIARMLNRNLEQELSEGLKKIDKSNNEYCFEILSGFLNYSQDNKRDLIDKLRTSLYLWTNPLIDYATSDSDFDIASLKKSKTTIYVGLDPTDIDRLQPLMRLFYNHAFERLITASRFTEQDNAGVTVILDDFYTIGKLEKYAFAYLRGYKVRLFAISSDIQHLEELYGKGETASIISDCNFKIFFASNDYKTVKYVPSLCVDKNENKDSISCRHGINLPQDSQIILLGKEQPIICKKIKYYEDEELKKKITTSVKF